MWIVTWKTIRWMSAPNVECRIVTSRVPGLSMPLREQLGLRRAINRDRPDLVHFLCNTAPVGIGRPYVLTLHDTIQVNNSNPFSVATDLSVHKTWAITAYSKWTILRTVRAAGRIITVSNYEREKIAEELNIARERICVTHLAPNEVFRPGADKERAGWRQDVIHAYGISGPYLMGIGYEPRKNIPLLIETYAELAPLHADLQLVIVAAQEQRRQEFQSLAESKGLSGRVVVLGGQPSAELMKLLNLAKLFVYPSERESFGLPPLEALACGAPTLAMDRSSIPEILGAGALLLDSDDATVWAATIAQIIEDREKLADLSARGLRRAAQLTWQRCARATIGIYYETLGREAPVLANAPAIG